MAGRIASVFIRIFTRTSMDFGQPFFMEIFMIGAWCIWKQRNDVIFDRNVPCLSAWKVAFKTQVLDHFVRLKPSLHSSIKVWLQEL
jgi:hypothetical protein